jgi:hypothetical protein
MALGVVVCSNGLGHFRRVCAVLIDILSNGYDNRVDIYGSREKLNILSSRFPEIKILLESRQIKVIDFSFPSLNSSSKLSNISHLSQLNWAWEPKFSFQEYDLVWSDNLLNILESRPDAKLTGSFFWHEVFEGVVAVDKHIRKFVEKEKDILQSAIPPMAGCEYFATSQVKTKTRFLPVGLYQYSPKKVGKKGNGILFSCGLGGEEEALARDALEKFLLSSLRPPGLLFVEPSILPKVAPDWVVPADFSSKMFTECIAACIRPGLGTLSDALINHLKIFGYARKGSFEMEHNGKALKALGLGDFSNDPYDMLLKACEYSMDKKSQIITFDVISKLNKAAVSDTSHFIVN